MTPSQPPTPQSSIPTSIVLTVLVIALVASGALYFWEMRDATPTDSTIEVQIQNKNTVASLPLNTNTTEWSATEVAEFASHNTACIRLLLNGAFKNPQAFFPIQDVSPLERLMGAWDSGTLCQSEFNSNVYTVQVSRQADFAKAGDAGAFTRTHQLYPRLSADTYAANDDGFRFHQAFIFTPTKTELVRGEQKRLFAAGSLTPLASIIWGAALSHCTIEPGNFVADGGVVIACGGGDNGCGRFERVQWDLLSGKSTYLGDCRNNCDLAPDEPYRYSCQP